VRWIDASPDKLQINNAWGYIEGGYANRVDLVEPWSWVTFAL